MAMLTGTPEIQEKKREAQSGQEPFPSHEVFSGWDKQYLWHPFTPMREWTESEFPIIASAKGVYLTDLEGRRYIDGVSSLWCNVHGHRVGKLDRALKRQVGKIAHSTFLGLSNVPAILLAKKLIEMVPGGLARVFYSDSGAEAVEIALKMAFQYWHNQGARERTKFIHLTNAYHGDTLGAVSVGGVDLFHSIYKPILFETIPVAAPYRYRDDFEGTEAEDAYAAFCAQRLEAALKQHHRETCAVVMEPLIQGAAGMVAHPAGFLKRARALTERYNVLLIADEVATGFGRTGTMFACERESVTPDLLCLAKGLSGGYLPLAATVTTERIYEAFLGCPEEFKTFFHGHTYTANPLACAAALASLELFEEERVLDRLKHKIEMLAAELKRFTKLLHVGDIRQQGFMAGIELVEDRHTKKPYAYRDQIGSRVAGEARRLGAVIRPLGNVIVIMPPLSIPIGTLRRLVRIVYRAAEQVTATTRPRGEVNRSSSTFPLGRRPVPALGRRPVPEVQ